MDDQAGADQASSISPPPRSVARLVVVVVAFFLCGCRTSIGVDPIAASALAPTPGESSSLHVRACHAWNEGRKLEKRGLDASVDRYYEAAVYSAAALTTAEAYGLLTTNTAEKLQNAYNEHLGDCLRTAQRFGRLDPQASLLVNTQAGPQVVPIRHLGFVWKPADFGQVVHPRDVPKNRRASRSHDEPGLGAALAVERPNPRQESQDDFLPRTAVFNATALLRPDLDAWLGDRTRPPNDVLEFHDPSRTSVVAFGPHGPRPLRSDLGVAPARARQIQEARGPYALDGFTKPEQMIDQADIRMLEPYQPGKPPVLLIHGLLNDPFLYTDMIVSLQRSPEFLQGRQIWVFRYPTGITFLRSAAILRKQIERVSVALDPNGNDPAMSDWTVIGYSMGGLVARLQVASSGDELWNSVATRPLEELTIPETSRETLRDLFYFEPSPRIGRVIFLATPHDGASPATAAASRLTSRVVRRPADMRHLVEELEQANPGAVRPSLRQIPTSVDALAAYSPLLPAIRRLPYSPFAVVHTIAGTGLHPPDSGKGDFVVPLTSAHVDEAVSEHRVRAVHTQIYQNPDAINEVRRILGVSIP